MTRDECKRAVHGRLLKLRPPTLESDARLDRLMLKHYPLRSEGPDYNFQAADVLELERKMQRGEGR